MMRLRPPPRPGLRPTGPRVHPRRAGHAYATASSSPPHMAPLQVFDRHVKLLQRERAACSPLLSRTTDYLKDHVAANLAERLLVGSHPPRWPAGAG